MRLINADEIPFISYINGSVNVEKEVVDSMKTIDAEPVIRCRDCKHYAVNHNGLWCGNTYSPAYGRGVYPDFYCAKSERRDTP